MSTIALDEPLILKDYTVKIDADNYEKAVSAVIIKPPSTSTETWQGPIGSEVSDESETGPWTVQVDYIQDWETTGSLSGYLYDHAGETKAMEFVPRAGTGKPKFTADVIVRSGQVGGNTRKAATSSVTMTCVAKPVRGTVAA